MHIYVCIYVYYVSIRTYISYFCPLSLKTMRTQEQWAPSMQVLVSEYQTPLKEIADSRVGPEKVQDALETSWIGSKEVLNEY